MRFFVLATLVLCAGPVYADAEKTRILNAFRVENNVEPVRYSKPLEAAAEHHAQDMARSGHFSHTGSDGSDVAARVTKTGYGWCFVAENIAKGQRNLAEVMQDWADSQGHRRNMLSGDATEFALAEGAGNIWVMVLASPGC